MALQPRAPAESKDDRLERLELWLAGLFGARDFEIRPASADASFRRYFRVTRAERTWIAMDAPPGKESLEPYIRVAAILADVGVNAPRVLEQNVEEGFLLNTDLGSRTYLAELQVDGNAHRLYEDAISALVRIQARAHGYAMQLPPYDELLLRQEMMLFAEWFCGRHLGLVEDTDALGMEAVYTTLATEALRQPRVFVHRDYHSRNLMVGDGARFGANPGILDFQDAVYGPVTYDLVSLLRDCYIAWPLESVHRWAELFVTQARDAGIDVGARESEFFRWFDLMGVQRHLKAIGIFARLWHRDGKPGYLKDIPRTLAYVSEVSARYDELKPLNQWLEDRVLPTLDRQQRCIDG